MKCAIFTLYKAWAFRVNTAYTQKGVSLSCKQAFKKKKKKVRIKANGSVSFIR
jgi:hypothetical protein